MKRVLTGAVAVLSLMIHMTSFAAVQDQIDAADKRMGDMYFNRARASFSSGNISEGTGFLKQAVIHNPGNVFSNELMMDVVYNYVKRGEMDKARELISFCQENFQDGEYLSWARFVEAEITAKQLKLDEALALLENILRGDLTPRYEAMSYSLLGAIYVERRKWDEAEENLRRSLQLLPDNKMALNDLAVVSINTGNYAEAIDLLVKVYGIDPSFVSAQQNIMYLNQRLTRFKKHDLVIKLSGGVIEISRDRESDFIKGAKIELARAYLMEKETDKAKNVLVQFMEDYPDEKDQKNASRMMMSVYASEKNIRKTQEYAAKSGPGFFLFTKLLEIIAGAGISVVIILFLFFVHRWICRIRKLSVYKGYEFRFFHIGLVFSSFLLIFPLVSLLTNLVLFQSVFPDFDFDFSALLFIKMSLSFFLWALIAGFFIFRKYNMRPAEVGLVKPAKPFITRSIFIILGMGAFGEMYKFIVTGLLKIPEPAPIVENLAKDLQSPLSVVFSFFVIIALIPVFEEFIYRGFFYEAFKRHSGVIGGAVFSSCLFAFSHADTFPYSFLPLFIFGVGLVYIRRKTNSLIPAILIHAINNLLALSVHYFRA